ncbi:hypothetical protein N7523_008878 [Penicillium sp. IBT 18751x]|nr:hypothetical protein N7523_008878 [Penicillium sp. IBT 18751x]
MDENLTPSSVGDIEAEVPISVPEVTAPLSVRVDKDGSLAHTHTAIHHDHPEGLLQPSHRGDLVSMQTIQPSALTVENVEDASPGSVRLGPSEFAITLPMDSRVKDDYEKTLTGAASIMREFFLSFSPTSQVSEIERRRLLPKMHEVIARLNNVSTHPDLNIPQHCQYHDSELAQEASWAEYSSAKFLFLKYWIELASAHDLHVILEVRGDMKQNILERYLLGKGFTYTKPRAELGGSVEISMNKGSLSFGIHGNDGVQELFKSPCAIIALDTTFDPRSPSVQHIRTTYTRNGSLLPVIWLLVANTCEHIGRCLPDLSESERLRLLLQETAHLHDDVGDLQDDALGVHEDVEEVLGYLSDNLASWTLPTIEPLHFITQEELDSSDPSSDEPMPTAPKRSMDDDGDEYTTKRARVETFYTGELTDSTKAPSQTLDHDLHSLEKSLVQLKNAHAAEKDQLQNELLETQARLQDFKKAMSELQHRYESRTKDLHKTRQNLERLMEGNTSLEQRFETLRENLSKIKDERTSLKQELEEARQELKNGGGTLAELETAREEIRRLTKESASLERKAEYSQNQAEYVREQYQTASNVAAQAGNEARQLREENEYLKKKVEGNMVQLREINKKNDEARHIARIEELEIILAARDEVLRKKEEELREIRKNRPSTRSTSTQPRSPKWAGSRPTSPGVNHNGNGNGLAGRGSALRFSSEMPF